MGGYSGKGWGFDVKYMPLGGEFDFELSPLSRVIDF